MTENSITTIEENYCDTNMESDWKENLIKNLPFTYKSDTGLWIVYEKLGEGSEGIVLKGVSIVID